MQHDIDEILAVSESSYSSGNNSSSNAHYYDDDDDMDRHEHSNEYVHQHDRPHDNNDEYVHDNEHENGDEEDQGSVTGNEEGPEDVLRRVHGIVGIIDHEIETIDNMSTQSGSSFVEAAHKGSGTRLMDDTLVAATDVTAAPLVHGFESGDMAHEEERGAAVGEAVEESQEHASARHNIHSHNNANFRSGDDDRCNNNYHDGDDDIAAAAVIDATLDGHLSNQVNYGDQEHHQEQNFDSLDVSILTGHQAGRVVEQEQHQEQLEQQQVRNVSEIVLLDTTEETEDLPNDIDDDAADHVASSLMTSPTIAYLSAARGIVLETTVEREREHQERNDVAHGSPSSSCFGSSEHLHSEHVQHGSAYSILPLPVRVASLASSPTEASLHDIHQEISATARAVVGREQHVADVTVTVPEEIESPMTTLQPVVPVVEEARTPAVEGGGGSAYYVGTENASAATTAARATRMRLEQRSRQRAAKVRAAAAEAKINGDGGEGSRSMAATKGGRAARHNNNRANMNRPAAGVNSSPAVEGGVGVGSISAAGKVQSAVALPPPELMARLSQGKF